MSVTLVTPNWETARQQFSAFIEPIQSTTNVVAVHDSDADGIAAGVLWQISFERAGFTPTRVLPDRERNPWTTANRARVQTAQPDRLFVMDLGSRAEPVIAGVPTCFIDHHHPDGVLPGDTLITAYTWEPIPNTSLLVWELCQAVAEVADLDWIAAIGTISDLGDRAPFDLVATAKRKYTAKYLKEATALINASRRASHYNPEAAAIALLTHANPKELVNSNADAVEQLRAARMEVKHALDDAKKVAPVFAGNVALINVSSPCQIHPLIAQIWKSRLPKHIVIAANDRYLPNRVNFSARSVQANVIDFLRARSLSDGDGFYGHGHDQASGGSLPIERWQELLQKLGFAPTERGAIAAS